MKATPSGAPLRLLSPSAALCALLPLLAGPGCGGGSGSGNKPASGQPLGVTRTTPSNGARGIAHDAPLEVRFSADVDITTVSPETFSVEGTASGPLTGVYSLPQPRIVVFRASRLYQKGETVRVALSSSLRSTAGQSLRATTFSFEIVPSDPPPPPVPPLTIDGSTPGPNDGDIARSVSVAATFSEALERSTASGLSAFLSSDAAGRIPAGVHLEDGNRRIVLEPSEPLPPGASVEASFNSDLRGANGASFTGESFRFRVRAAPPPRPRELDRVFGAIGKVKFLLAADLDSDGLSDAVYASENESVFDVLVSKGDGTFDTAIRIEVGQQLHSLAASDWDRDGDLDLLAGTVDRAVVFWNRSRENGAAALRFERGPEAPAAGSVRGMAAGDLDHAGGPDLVVDTDRGIQVFVGSLTSPRLTIGTERQARTPIVIADVNLDGHLDIAYGNRRQGRVTYHVAEIPSPGQVSFPQAQHIEVGSDADQIAVENLSGDPLPEVLVLLAGSASSGGSALRLFLQGPSGFTGGEGSLAQADELDSGTFALGDLDGDGTQDIALASASSGKVVWFSNDDGVFDLDGAGETLLTTPGALLVATADVSGDGSLDMVVAAGNEIHTLLPRGTTPPPPPPDDEFEISVDSSQVRREDTGAAALVKLKSTKPVQAYTVVLEHDPAAITPRSVTIDGTVTGSGGAEFTNYRVLGSSMIAYSAIMDFEPPMDGKTIPAGESMLLFRLVYDVPATAPLGLTEIVPRESGGDPAVLTELVVASESREPDLSAGSIEILPPKDPGPTGPNIMQLGDTSLAPGAEGFMDVLGTAESPIEAFTTLITFDPAVVEILAFELEGTVSAPLEPDLVVPSIRTSQGYAVYTIIFDFTPPFDRQTIPPGEDMKLFRTRVRAQQDAIPGTYPLRLENGLGDPPLNNIFVFDGQSIFPELGSGELRIVQGQSTTFLRGDFDASGVVNMADSVAIVDYLFRGGTAPVCQDAADADDSGRVNLSDSVYLLDFLFRGQAPPPAPFPGAGADPTQDTLSCG